MKIVLKLVMNYTNKIHNVYQAVVKVINKMMITNYV